MFGRGGSWGRDGGVGGRGVDGRLNGYTTGLGTLGYVTARGAFDRPFPVSQFPVPSSRFVLSITPFNFSLEH